MLCHPEDTWVPRALCGRAGTGRRVTAATCSLLAFPEPGSRPQFTRASLVAGDQSEKRRDRDRGQVPRPETLTLCLSEGALEGGACRAQMGSREEGWGPRGAGPGEHTLYSRVGTGVLYLWRPQKPTGRFRDAGGRAQATLDNRSRWGWASVFVPSLADPTSNQARFHP